MAFNTYVKIEDTILPLPDSFELSYSYNIFVGSPTASSRVAIQLVA